MAESFKILVADKLAEQGLEYLRQADDVTVEVKTGLAEQELAGIVGQYDGLMVRSGVQVTAGVLADPGHLKVIARAGVGVDNIDLEAATAKGILVMNSAEASTVSTAEHAFALMIGLARHIGPSSRRMAEGGWDRSKYVGRQLAGKTLGVIGLGRIGRTMAQRALAFDMNVVAYDPFYNAPTALDGQVRMYSAFADLLPYADVLSFHVPLNEQTRGMLNAETYALCRDGVMVVNAARGGIVDEQATLEALESGKCAGAAFDVYLSEPPPEDSPLRGHPNVLTTPHLGASTVEAQQAVSTSAAEQLLAYLRGKGIGGAVNAGDLRVDLDPLQACFVDLADRMAKLIGPMITRGISSVTIELIGQPILAAAGNIERAALVSLLSRHLTEPLNAINVNRLAEQRGIKVRTTTGGEAIAGAPQVTVEIEGPTGATDDKTDPRDHSRRIVGRVYDDMRPRVIEINGYYMDMVPAGTMLVVQNDDRPGMVGLVGTEFGKAQINIADMAISRRGSTALMLLKLDEMPNEATIEHLRSCPGILKTAVINLPTLPAPPVNDEAP